METFLEFLRFLIWLRGLEFRDVRLLAATAVSFLYLLVPKGVRGVPRCAARSIAALWAASIAQTLQIRNSENPKMTLFSI